MKQIVMENALRHYPNRFELTMMAAARAKELQAGESPTLPSSSKPVVVALEEIGDGRVVPCSLEDMERIREYRRAARERALLAQQEAEQAERERAGEVEPEASEDLEGEG